MHRPLSAFVLFGLLAIGPHAAEAVHGFRGDGSGFYPDCAGLPQEWAEDRNVVWKVRLPRWSHSEPLLVGGRLYVLEEPDPVQAPGQIGPSLTCMDPADGTVLWTKPHDHWDLLGPEAEKIRTSWIAHQECIIKMKRHRAELAKSEITVPIGQLSSQQDEELSKKMQAANEGCFQKFKGTGPSVDFAGGSVSSKRSDYLRKNGAWYQSWCYPQADFTGYGMGTPTSDGKRIFFRTPHHVVYCTDLEGKRLWATRYNTVANCGGDAHLTSLLHYDGKLFVYTQDLRSAGKDHKKEPADRSLIALDPATGKELWASQTTWQDLFPCALGSPLPMEIDGTKAVYIPLGMVIRTTDGKTLVRGIGHEHDANNAVIVDGRTIVGVNGGGDSGWDPAKDKTAAGRAGVAKGTGMFAVRISKKGEEFVAEDLWYLGHGGRQEGLAYANGLIFAPANCDKIRAELVDHKNKGGMVAIDPATGKVVGHQQKMGSDWWKPVVADGLLFNGSGEKGRFTVATADQQMRLLGDNFLLGRKDDPSPKAAEGGSLGGRFYKTLGFVPSGNRIFVRGWEVLYCLGDPSKPLRLSERHR